MSYFTFHMVEAVKKVLKAIIKTKYTPAIGPTAWE